VWSKGILATLFRLAVHLPGVSSYVANEKKQNGQMFWDKYINARKDQDVIKVLPAEGMSYK